MNNELALLMQRNLTEVWSERNADNRMIAIEDIYTSNASLYHVEDKISSITAINATVSATLSNFPAEFAFTQLKPVIINNDIGRLNWAVGPKGAAPVATGMDIAVFENGKIKALYVFLDT
jgi:hypothetical protein